MARRERSEEQGERDARAVASRCAAQLGRLGIDATTVLGCGLVGCLFPAGQGRVAKVIVGGHEQAEREIQATLWVARLAGRRPPGLPEVHAVYRIPRRQGTCAWPKGPATIVLREDIGELQLGDHRQPFAHYLNGLTNEFFWSPGRGIYEHELRAWKQLTEFERGLLLQAKELFRWAEQEGLILSDAFVANWGLRDGRELVLRDFGMTLRRDRTDLVARRGRQWTGELSGYLE